MRLINGNWRTHRTKEISLAGWQLENVKKMGCRIDGLIDILGDFVLFDFITRWIRFRLLERKGENDYG